MSRITINLPKLGVIGPIILSDDLKNTEIMDAQEYTSTNFNKKEFKEAIDELLMIYNLMKDDNE